MTTFKAIFALLGAAWCAIFPTETLHGMAITLCVLAALDLCTGVAGAWHRKEVSSRAFVWGLIRKSIGYGSLLVAVSLVSRHVPGFDGLQAIGVGGALTWLITGEFLSVLENLKKMDIAVAGRIQDALAATQPIQGGEQEPANQTHD